MRQSLVRYGGARRLDEAPNRACARRRFRRMPVRMQAIAIGRCSSRTPTRRSAVPAVRRAGVCGVSRLSPPSVRVSERVEAAVRAHRRIDGADGSGCRRGIGCVGCAGGAARSARCEPSGDAPDVAGWLSNCRPKGTSFTARSNGPGKGSLQNTRNTERPLRECQAFWWENRKPRKGARLAAGGRGVPCGSISCFAMRRAFHQPLTIG